ncbi:MAG: lysyl oxidase family protein [Pirellulales bacterium]
MPWVREDAPYLVNWDITSGNLRMQTMFANIGDGLLQLRTDLAGTGGATTPLTQRVFSGVDNGPIFQDYFVESAVNFHQDHGHIHFENFSEFQLLEALTDPSGVVTVGNLAANTVKTSYNISDTNPIPDPLYAGKVSYPSPSTSRGFFQNISVGWGDVYSHGTPGQSISLVGVPFGPKYWLRQTVDPTNVLREKSETNNSFEILIDLNHPGEAIRHLDSSFVQPGDVAPLPPGDLTGDRLINILDWTAFKAAATADLTGVSDEMALMLGDLNLDGKHSLSDVLLFRQYFDEAQGAGAFAAIQQVPEPSTVVLGGAAIILLLARRHVVRRPRAKWFCFAVLAVSCAEGSREAAANVTLFYEDFNGLTLGPNVHETLVNPLAWTDSPPSGWSVDDSGVPFVADSTRGVTEWEGWSFADKAWWSTVAGDQQRSQFTLGQGTVAVADPDEWDDRGNPINGTPFAGYYNALFKTPVISLSGAAPGTAKLTFASSWRDECCDDGPSDTNSQTARIRVSYDGGNNFSQVLRWESSTTSPFFKNDATNETVVLDLNNPLGAANVIVEFGLLNAGNDWWWAIDNVEVFTPTALEVNTNTRQLSIIGAAEMTGYEITSLSSSLNHAGWEAGNLDAQNFGPPVLLSADFNNDNSVNAADYPVWRKSFGPGDGGDANGDGNTDQFDYDDWKQQFGQSLAAVESWETLISTNQQFLEFFLLGSSTFASQTIGAGYNTAIDGRDLTFTYTTVGDQEFVGIVRYVSGAGLGSSAVPEPAAGAMFLAGIVAMLSSLRSAVS